MCDKLIGQWYCGWNLKMYNRFLDMVAERFSVRVENCGNWFVCGV